MFVDIYESNLRFKQQLEVIILRSFFAKNFITYFIRNRYVLNG